MGFVIDKWMKQYTAAAKELFGERIWFIGLQGSYGRGEATEGSDIDAVLILDTVSAEDLASYAKMLDTLPNRDKACGFVSGRKELLTWEPSDLFQFYYDTTPILGTLDELLNRIHQDDVRRAVRIGACNVYHMCAHNLVHEKNADILKGLYKSAAFTLRAVIFLKTGRFEKKTAALLKSLEGADLRVLQAGVELKEKDTLSEDELKRYSALLLDWASEWICRDTPGTEN